jgi:uncharacterized protein (TIGR00251 family)
MHIQVHVTPRSSQKKIVLIDGVYKVYIHEIAADGKANKAVIDMIADYFNVPKSSVSIIRGIKNKNKVLEIFK